MESSEYTGALEHNPGTSQELCEPASASRPLPILKCTLDVDTYARAFCDPNVVLSLEGSQVLKAQPPVS